MRACPPIPPRSLCELIETLPPPGPQVRSGCVPNLNTYRILINACQRADQAQLAIEVYATMRAKRIPILQKVGSGAVGGGGSIGG